MDRLTPREYEILGMMRDGCGNPEMAMLACISKHTVKAHISSILKKLNAKNRTRAIYLATKEGLID